MFNYYIYLKKLVYLFIECYVCIFSIFLCKIFNFYRIFNVFCFEFINGFEFGFLVIMVEGIDYCW